MIQKVLVVVFMVRWLSEGASLSAGSGSQLSLPSLASLPTLAAQSARPQTALTQTSPMRYGPKLFDQPDPSTLEPEAEPADPEIRLPDLQVLPPFDLQLKRNKQTRRINLRLAITFWNNGQGPLELRGAFNPASRQAWVWQSVYTTDHASHKYLAGEFIWHPGHEHWHFTNFALYELWSLSPDGSLNQVVASSGKVTFCILETDVIDPELPDFSRWRRYAVCGPGLQGLSVGWGDTYDAYLEGQSVEITGIPDGVYALKVTVDPIHRIWEADEANNAAVTYIEIVEERLTVFAGEDHLLKTLRLCLRFC